MLSAPLTCCSIGAATLFATHISAWRPDRWRDTVICGGVMSGYCAIGRPEHRDRAAERDDDRDDRREDRPVDAEVGDVHGGGAVSGLFRLSVSRHIFARNTRCAGWFSAGANAGWNSCGVTSGAVHR